MCGIAGLVRITPKGQPREEIPEEWLDALDADIAWRGPDGQGRFRDVVTRPDGSIVEVALVHRRLSIIDHAGGAQPMVSEHGRVRADGTTEGLVAVAFNGCIYNARELREELTAGGHAFITEHSDTEVLIHLWRDCADDREPMGEGDLVPFPDDWTARLEGMYAAAVWDRERARLTVARDSFGEKPLHMAEVGGRAWAFASTTGALNALLREVASPSKLSARPLTDWIAMGFSEVDTPFHGIHTLSAGHWAVLPDPSWRAEPGGRMGILPGVVLVIFGASALVVLLVTGAALAAILVIGFVLLLTLLPVSPRRALRAVGLADQNRIATVTDDLEAVDRLLREAVERRLEADAPLGCFLSGGIDSSLVALHAHRALGNLTTLCVRMNDPRYDESAHARQAGKIIGSRHVEVDITSSMHPAEDLVHLIETLGLPFGDSSILPTYWVCKAAREHMKVALSGDGGDELFYGYDRYRAAARFGAVTQLLAHLLPALRGEDPKSARERRTRFVIAARHRWYLDLLAIFPTPDRKRLLGRKTGFLTSLDPVRGVRRARDFDIEHYLPGDLLRKVDTASMAAGLEVRCPFLDTELAAYADRIPVSLTMRGGRRKALLRDIARRYFPDDLVDRPKMGFAIPVGEWFRDDFGGMRSLMVDALSGEHPFGPVHEALPIRMNALRRFIDEHTERRRDHSQRLFALTVLAIWARWFERTGSPST